MTFEPKNTSTFYTAIMKVLQDEGFILFNDTKHIFKSDIPLTNIFCNSKTIIDDTLIFSNYIPTYFIIFLVLLKSLLNIDFLLN